ncbi:hypothetical protein JOM56_008303 [Amanita muscaria]
MLASALVWIQIPTCNSSGMQLRRTNHKHNCPHPRKHNKNSHRNHHPLVHPSIYMPSHSLILPSLQIRSHLRQPYSLKRQKQRLAWIEARKATHHLNPHWYYRCPLLHGITGSSQVHMRRSPSLLHPRLRLLRHPLLTPFLIRLRLLDQQEPALFPKVTYTTRPVVSGT